MTEITARNEPLNHRELLHTENLTYRYPAPQQERGLDAVSLDVGPGEAVLLSGPSGCGKSTLARCLTGLIPHLYHGQLQGTVQVNGMDTVGSPLWQLAEAAGMVFQNPASQMLSATVEGEIIFGLENLGLDRETIRERLDETISRFGLTGLRDRVPLTLSGGEQQRLALASVVARRPSVLVLDEPLSMLDSTAVVNLTAHLADLKSEGASVVVCEHRTEPLRAIPGLRTVVLGGDGEACVRTEMPQGPFPARVVEPFVLDLSGLTVRLGGREILQNLDWTVAGGTVVAIVGRNGAGKTTLLRALAGLQSYSGEVTVDGQSPDLRMVFQNPDLQLFNPSVRDEILYRIDEPDMARYEWLVQSLGLVGYEDTPPLLLSEGEKKRLVLATVLMRGARHGVLLDEPALGQDRAHKLRLVHLMRALADAGQLVIMTTHDFSLARKADRIVVMGEGGFLADGEPEAVLADGAVWRRSGLVVPEWLDEVVL